MNLLLLGATGLVGGRALTLALSNPAISKVVAPTRKPLVPNPKLLNPVVPDLEQLLSDVGSAKPDAVLCALGTTRAKAGSKDAFRRIERDLPVAFGKAAHAAGAQTYAIVTVLGASTHSRLFYLKTKGEVEDDIQAIGFPSLTICRPSLIDGERAEHRLAESLGLALARSLAPVLPKKFRVNPAEVIAAALLDAVVVARPGCRWIHADAMN